MYRSAPSRNTSARNPSHFGSNSQPSPSGRVSAAFASIGSTGGAIGNAMRPRYRGARRRARAGDDDAAARGQGGLASAAPGSDAGLAPRPARGGAGAAGARAAGGAAAARGAGATRRTAARTRG